jgi:steroid delta-isomerase-like uncharacterized protein
MNREHIRLIEQVAELRTAHDIDRLSALFAEDVLFEDVPLGVVARGRDEMKALFTGTWASIPDFAMRLESVMTEYDLGGAEWIMSGTHLGDFPRLPASGASISIRAVATMGFPTGS